MSMLVFAFLFFITSLPVVAQPSAPLDLKGSIQYALANNLDIRTLQKLKAVAEAEIQTQRQFGNPSLIGETTRSQPNYFVGAGYFFELGGKRRSRIEIARNEARVADVNLQAGISSLRHDVRVAFYELLQSHSRLDQISVSRDLAKRLLDISRERFDAGAVPKLEVLQAELELKRRENDLQQVQNVRKAVEVRFNRLLNRSPEDEINLDGSLEEQPGALLLESLVERAIAERAEIKSLEAEKKAEEARLSLARAERIPDLQMEGGTEIHDLDFQYGWRAGLSFEIPLLNQKKGEIAGATATLESLQAEEESEKQKVRSEVREEYLKFHTAEFRVENFRKEILPAATELEQLSQESYREGKSAILSALDAQRNSLEVRLQYLDALMDYQAALADLEKAVGKELE